MNDNKENMTGLILNTVFKILFSLSLAYLGIQMGMDIVEKKYQKTAIKHNAAYYHPITGDFVWRTNLPPIIP